VAVAIGAAVGGSGASVAGAGAPVGASVAAALTVGAGWADVAALVGPIPITSGGVVFVAQLANTKAIASGESLASQWRGRIIDINSFCNEAGRIG
jgi:hypothetical protein